MHKEIPDKKNIIIIGASGHGGMILDSLEKDGNFNVLGFVDSFKDKGTDINGYRILGNERHIPLLLEKFDLYGAILAIGNNWTRKAMVDKIAVIAPNLPFITAVHPSAIIGKGVTIGRGSVVMPGVIVNSNSKIGDFCILNTNSSLGHEGSMENFSSMASGVCTGGNLVLKRFSAISLGANVIEHITVGEHSVIGAGSLVVDDVESYSLVYGSPACFVRNRKEDDPYLRGDK